MPIKSALVVDDSKSAGLMLRRMLEQNSLLVDVTESGEEALVFLRSKLPDVIFMDHIMPGMNGLEAAKAIRDNPKTADIPIIMYTSKEGDAYVEQVKAHGVFGILPKPAKPSALTRIIQELSARPEATPAPAPASIAVPPAPPAAPTVSAGVATVVDREAIARLLDEQLAQFKNHLLVRCEQAAVQAATDACRAHSQELASQLRAELQAGGSGNPALSPEVLAELKSIAAAAGAQQASAAAEAAQGAIRQTAAETAKHSAGDVARHVANEVFQTHANELAVSLRKHIQDQVSRLESRVSEPRPLAPAELEEIRVAARTAALPEASDAARQAAQKLIQQAAQDISRETTTTINRQVARVTEIAEQLRKEMHHHLGEIKSAAGDARGLSAAALDEVKTVARSAAAQKAVEATHRAVTELGQQTQEGVRQAARQAVHDLVKARPPVVDRSFVLAAATAAAAVAIFASILLRVLH